MKRSECINGPRPCPWVSCWWHLLFDTAPLWAIRRMSDDELVERLCGMEATCALDIAAFGGATLDEIGSSIGVSRERVRQLEEIGLRKINHRRAGMVRVLGEFRFRDVDSVIADSVVVVEGAGRELPAPEDFICDNLLEMRGL